ITSVLTWMATLSYIHRAQTNLFGMDTMMNILLIYLMIGPSGAALSVDRLIRRWWAARQARREGRPVPAWEPPAPPMSARPALALLVPHHLGRRPGQAPRPHVVGRHRPVVMRGQLRVRAVPVRPV